MMAAVTTIGQLASSVTTANTMLATTITIVAA
jgi:hypothetical protein